MEDEGACEDGFLPDVLVNICGYRRFSDDRLRGGSCGLGFSFGFVGELEVDMANLNFRCASANLPSEVGRPAISRNTTQCH